MAQMKRLPFSVLMTAYLEAHASLAEQMRLEKWIAREEKRLHRFRRRVLLHQELARIFPEIQDRLNKVNSLRKDRNLCSLEEC